MARDRWAVRAAVQHNGDVEFFGLVSRAENARVRCWPAFAAVQLAIVPRRGGDGLPPFVGILRTIQSIAWEFDCRV